MELALALQKVAIYPAGHPMLKGAVERLHARMLRGLVLRGQISMGIAQHRVIIEGVETDASHTVLRELAAHFHGHHIAAVRILHGVEPHEVEDFLSVVAIPASRTERPLGHLPAAECNRWRHIVLYPNTFDNLELMDEEQGSAGGESQTRAAELWLGLARAALASDVRPADGTYHPEHVAGAINSHKSEGAYDEVIVGYLLQATDELAAASGASSESLGKNLSRTVRALRPETLRRLVEMGGDRAQRMRFVANSADTLLAGAVLDILDAAMSVSGGPISGAMTRLLRKLASSAEAQGAAAPAADSALRQHVKGLLSGWALDDPNPDAYTEVLGNMAQAVGAVRDDHHRDEAEPERILEISLDVETVGVDTEVALSRLVMREGLLAAIERLESAPASATREALLDRILNASLLREQLSAERPDLRVLKHGVARLQGDSVEALVGALETRKGDLSWLVELFVEAGPAAAPALGAAFEGLKTESQRALLAVFERWNVWPPQVNLPAVARHADPSMRRAALRLLVKHEATREEAILIGLRDPDERIFAQALMAATKVPARGAVGTLMQRALEPTLSEELRVRAVRYVAASKSPEALPWLVGILVRRHWLSGEFRLRARSAVTVAGLAGLALHWRGVREADVVLGLAARSKDEEFRRASALVAGTP